MENCGNVGTRFHACHNTGYRLDKVVVANEIVGGYVGDRLETVTGEYM